MAAISNRYGEFHKLVVVRNVFTVVVFRNKVIFNEVVNGFLLISFVEELSKDHTIWASIDRLWQILFKSIESADAATNKCRSGFIDVVQPVPCADKVDDICQGGAFQFIRPEFSLQL